MGFTATMAIASSLRVKIAQLAVSAAGVAVRVRWLMWAVAKGITFRKLRTNTSAVAVFRDTYFATVRLRLGFRTVGDCLVPSPAGVLLLNAGKGLHHSSPYSRSHPSTTHTNYYT